MRPYVLYFRTMKPAPDQDAPPPGTEATDFARAFLDGWEALCLSSAESIFRLGAQGIDLLHPPALAQKQEGEEGEKG